MLALRRSALLLLAGLALVGCEAMEPSGNPFKPASVKTVAASEGGVDPEAAVDPRFADFDEGPTVYSSEELRTMAGPTTDAEAPAAEVDPETGQARPAAPAAAPAAAPTASPAGAVAAIQMAPTSVVPMVLPKAALGWAVRLVTTVPNAQPPRAILGLPDGSEVVVTPGAMVPDAGLVVLSIGPQAVQLARVKANGDHATVDAFNLTPQY